MTRISEKDGSRFSWSRKYSWQKARSSADMAMPSSLTMSLICFLVNWRKPSMIRTSAGLSAFISRESGLSNEACRASTGLIRCFLILSKSAAGMESSKA